MSLPAGQQARVGTQAKRTNLSADAGAGATHIRVRNGHGFVVGDKITVGTRANKETVSITAVDTAGPAGAGIGFMPALYQAHTDGEEVVETGTGLNLVAPLKFNHSDGVDTGSNCADFLAQAAATLSAASEACATNIKVGSVAGFEAGETVMIDLGANREAAAIATVGTAGATTVSTTTGVGATVIPVAGASGFREGQTITIDSGANSEMAVVASIRRFAGAAIAVAAPLALAHAAGAQLSGTGITLTAPLTRAHASGAHVADNLPTPGAPNHYYRRPH